MKKKRKRKSADLSKYFGATLFVDGEWDSEEQLNEKIKEAKETIKYNDLCPKTYRRCVTFGGKSLKVTVIAAYEYKNES